MGPLPKRRHSQTRRNKRRSHDALTLDHLVDARPADEYHVAHHVCPNCGSYNGEQVIEVKSS